MKALLAGLLVLSTASISSAAYIMTKNVRGCSFWSYSTVTGVNGYVCSSPDFGTDVPDAYSVQNYITTLEQKTQDLERRIQVLEAKP